MKGHRENRLSIYLERTRRKTDCPNTLAEAQKNRLSIYLERTRRKTDCLSTLKMRGTEKNRLSIYLEDERYREKQAVHLP